MRLYQAVHTHVLGILEQSDTSMTCRTHGENKPQQAHPIKLLKTKNKDKIIKAARERQHVLYKGIAMRMETMNVKLVSHQMQGRGLKIIG